jgi:hypothetical protein
MHEFKGTKGPWRVSEMRGDLIDIRHNDEGISLNLAHVVARRSWLKEAEANAKLIAAAPELLEAVRQLHDYVEDTHCESHDECEPSHPMALARAAIAKALGQ